MHGAMAKKPCGSEPALQTASWKPSSPSCGTEGHDAEDTSMASDGQLRSLRDQVLVPCGLLGCPGTRSTMQRCSGSSNRSQVGSVEPSKKLRLINLPNQSWHRCGYHSSWVPGSTFCVCLVVRASQNPTPPRKGEPAACQTQRDVPSKKKPVLGSHSSHTVNMLSRQSMS